MNKNQLWFHLVQLPKFKHNQNSVDALIDPADKQNVPKAVALIQSIDQLQHIDSTGFDPARLNKHRSLVTIGKIFSSFTNPFIDINMNLSEQLASLSKYAHAAFAVYLKHSTNFMTSALYADTQAIVKDVYFCVAKQKLLDPQANFYIIHCGTDRLETSFCLARTQTHHRNFDILDLSGKLATSSLIDAIFARNPELDTGSRRLKVSGAIGIDHLNPKSWVGDVGVDKVSLQLCWEKGRKQAAALISFIYPGDPVADFSAVLRLPNHDLSRPTGKYVGFSNEVDFSIADDQPDSTQAATQPHSNTPHPEDDGNDEDGDAEGDIVYEDLEDLLPDSSDAPIDGLESSPKDWLEISGQDYLKASLVSQYLKANRSKKVVERTLRVRGVTLDSLRKHPPEAAVDPNGDNFQVGDLAATLVRAGSLICLAILQTIGIQKDRQTYHAIGIDTLRDPKEDYFIRSEVLRFIQSDPDTWSWLSRDFVKVAKPKKSQHRTSTVQDFTLSVPGQFCYRINPEIHDLPHQRHPPDQPDPDCHIQETQTWAFHANDLEQLLRLMWSDFQPEDPHDLSKRLKLLPQVWGSDGLPYTDNSGMKCFIQYHDCMSI